VAGHKKRNSIPQRRRFSTFPQSDSRLTLHSVTRPRRNRSPQFSRDAISAKSSDCCKAEAGGNGLLQPTPMKNLLKENTRARSMVRTLADCVRLVLGPCRPRGFQRKMPQHSRGLLLSMLPTNAVGAEIGVHEGDFSRRILDILKPFMRPNARERVIVTNAASAILCVPGIYPPQLLRRSQFLLFHRSTKGRELKPSRAEVV
jgi:hypothetical protein